jgi:protein gp37
MNKTKIEWVKNPDSSQGFTWNPITGCLNNCEYCYARKLANGRLQSRYLANNNLIPPYEDSEGVTHTPTNIARTSMPFYPRFWESRLREGIFDLGSKPKGIFVCDMSDLFGIGIPEMWTRKILAVCNVYPQHRFYLLTKQPANLIKFSPFPENCWVGVTATNGRMVDDAGYWLERIDAKVKYLSLEPLLEPIQLYFGKPGISWLIIGAQTNPYKPPEIEWVREIVEAADKAGIRVFLKNNLESLVYYQSRDYDICWATREDWGLRQEMPHIVATTKEG